VASRAGIALEGVVGELIQHCLSVLHRIHTLSHFGALRPCRLIGVNRKWVFYGQSDTIDPVVWSGRALQEDFAELAVSGLASMYPASDWSMWCSGPSWISARVRSR
jgi:hypothetical protein